jgi:hypothetical protein
MHGRVRQGVASSLQIEPVDRRAAMYTTITTTTGKMRRTPAQIDDRHVERSNRNKSS